VSHQEDELQAADLGRVGEDLSRSLRRCSGMVRDYRSLLIAANSNEVSFILSSQADNDAEHRLDREDREQTG
jgi:hypothetical protein